MIKALAGPYVDATFVPTGGVNEVNLLEYLNFPKVIACGGSWMVDQKAIVAKDWAKIEEITASAVNRMLGFELKHIGVNSGDPETAMKDAQALAKILGWPIKDGNSSTFTGTAFEFMKKPFRGTHGHIALGTNYIQRAAGIWNKRALLLMTKARLTKMARLSPFISRTKSQGLLSTFCRSKEKDD